MEIVRLLGVRIRSRSLYLGSENDAKGYRDAGVLDAGDLEIPSYLPHYSLPPIRNWPGPYRVGS